MFLIKIDFASPTFDEYIKMRYDELLEPFGLDWDEETILEEEKLEHYGLFDADFQFLGGVQLDPAHASVKQLVIRKAIQKKGLGSFVLKELEKIAAAKHMEQISLLAHKSVLPFYEKQGFVKEGNPKQVAGIEHQLMTKKIEKITIETEN
jgi:GNAT superfamily N-acetyltransferase